MTAYDVRGKASAARMLATIAGGGKGQAITLTRNAAGAYDPATGSPAITTTTQSATGVVLEYKTFIRQGVSNEKGSLIQKGDKQMLLSPLDTSGAALTQPEDGDVATVGGVDYTITSVAPLAPAGTAIYFECNIRGAP